MDHQYYRVKVEWPLPYFCKDLVIGNGAVTSAFGSQFYSTATDLRGVHLDIQAHLAKNYANEGLNEFDEFTDDQLLPPDEILRTYGRLQQPMVYEVEPIVDPEQIDLIDRALDQAQLVKNVASLIAVGFIPTPIEWNKVMWELNGHGSELDRAIGQVLRPWYLDDAFEILATLVEQGDAQLQELNTYTRSFAQKPKN